MQRINHGYRTAIYNLNNKRLLNHRTNGRRDGTTNFLPSSSILNLIRPFVLKYRYITDFRRKLQPTIEALKKSKKSYKIWPVYVKRESEVLSQRRILLDNIQVLVIFLFLDIVMVSSSLTSYTFLLLFLDKAFWVLKVLILPLNLQRNTSNRDSL